VCVCIDIIVCHQTIDISLIYQYITYTHFRLTLQLFELPSVSVNENNIPLKLRRYTL